MLIFQSRGAMAFNVKRCYIKDVYSNTYYSKGYV